MSLQSTPASAEPFLMHPDNYAFVTGQQRRVSRRSSAGCLAVFMAGFVVFGIVFFVITARDALRWWSIESSGVVTSGQFVERWVSVADSDTHHYVSFRYFHGQIPYETEQRINQEVYDRAESGSQVDIRFVPANPTFATIVGANHFPIGLAVFVLMWNAFVLILADRVWRQYWRLRVLEQKGILVAGTLTGRHASQDGEGNLLLHVEYCFNSPDANTPISGEEIVVRNDLKDTKLPKAGSTIYVLYHPLQRYMLL